MVADVMDISAQRRLARTALEPAEVLSLAWSDALSQCYISHAHVSFDAGHKQKLDADPAQLHRAFVNIFVNALQASGGGEPKVYVRTWQESPSRVGISVRNTGTHIDEEVRVRIFDLFFSSGKANGTGLGLAIVKKVVEMHEGAVECRSERTAFEPMGFVEFVFELPAHEAASQEHVWPSRPLTMASSAAPTDTVGTGAHTHALAHFEPGRRLRIAFLDDSITFRAAWKALLQGCADFQVFAHPHVFWSKCQKEGVFLSDYDVVITDLHFGLESESRGLGLAFACELRERGYGGFVVLCTNDDTAKESDVDTIDAVVGKTPLDLQSLQKLIAKDS
jgi:hypothetical protein